MPFYHQFTGSPVNLKTVASLEKAIQGEYFCPAMCGRASKCRLTVT
ncbi:MAG: dihydroneopterin aldolase family protein [Methanolobus sp.]